MTLETVERLAAEQVGADKRELRRGRRLARRHV